MHQTPLQIFSGRVRPHYRHGEREGYEVIYETDRGQRISSCSYFTADQAHKELTDILTGKKPTNKI